MLVNEDQATLIVDDDEKWAFVGVVNFYTISSLQYRVAKQLKNGWPSVLDFSQITRADSSLLAMLIMFIRIGQEHSPPVLKGVPDHVHGIAKLCGVDSLLASAIK